MNRVLRIIVLGVALVAVAFGQVEPRTRAERRAAAPAASISPGDSSSPAPRRLYEHHTNFYEFVLHQLNPNDKDWGAWYEERRAALIDAALHDPCFWYCLGLTLACLCCVAAVLKSQSDQDRQDDIMEERLDEVRRFAALSSGCSRIEGEQGFARHDGALIIARYSLLILCARSADNRLTRHAITAVHPSQLTT